MNHTITTNQALYRALNVRRDIERIKHCFPFRYWLAERRRKRELRRKPEYFVININPNTRERR